MKPIDLFRAGFWGSDNTASIIAGLFAQGQQGFWLPFTDFASLSQDSAGTLPYTALEQPVGRVLDRSGRGNHASQPTSTARGVVSARVNALLNTDNSAAWGYAGTRFSVGSKDVDDGWPLTALINSASALAAVNTDYPIGAGAVTDATIVRSIELQAGTASFVRFGAASGTDAVTVDLVAKAIVSNAGALPVTIVPLADNWVRIEFWSSRASFSASSLSNYLAWGLSQSGGTIGATGQIGSTIKVRKPSYSRQALGYTAPVPFQRVGAKYNRLINTEDFSKYQLSDASVVSNTHLAPDGTMTADSLTLNSSSSYANNSFPMGLVSVGQAVTVSVFSLSATNVLYIGGATPTGTDTLQSINVGAGWYRHWITRVFTESRVGTLQLLVSGFAPAGTGVKVVWGTQAVFGADPLPYEAVNTPTDYDAVGFPKYLRLDGTDDNYSCGGGGSTTGFYYSDVVRPTSSATTVLFSDIGTNSGYEFAIMNTGVLKLFWGNGTSFSSVSIGGVLISALNHVAVWDDASNIYLQINGGTPVTVARGVFVAGTANCKLYRTNGASAFFFNGQVTEPIYRAGPPPNAYERDVIRNYQMQKAGML